MPRKNAALPVIRKRRKVGEETCPKLIACPEVPAWKRHHTKMRRLPLSKGGAAPGNATMSVV